MTDQTTKPNPKRGPTGRQRKLAELLLSNPEWPLARAIREAGYSDSEALHAAREVVDRRGTQEALADARPRYRAQLAKRLTPEQGADRLVELAMQDGQPGTALNAMETILEHMGIVEQKNRHQVVVLAFQHVNQVFAPLLMKYLPQPQQEAFARELIEVTGYKSNS